MYMIGGQYSFKKCFLFYSNVEQQQENEKCLYYKDFRKSLYWTNTYEHKYDPVKTKFWTECAMTLIQVFKTNKRKILHFEKALDSSTSFYLHTVCAAIVSKVFAQVFHYKT